MTRFAALACLLPTLALCQANLNLQEGAENEPPPGWFVLNVSQDVPFIASWHRQGCRNGLPCASLTAPANASAGGLGTLMQSFDGTPYQGKPVVLRAWIRLESKAAGDHAQMLLHVSRPNLQQGFVDTMANRPITSAEWQLYEIRGDVAPDGDKIQIGLSLYGTGRVWLSAVEFGALVEATAGPAVDAAREAIGNQYARMDAAFVRGSAADMGAVLMPGAQMRVGTIREPLLPAIQQEIAKGSKLAAKTEVLAVRLAGGQAIATVRREAADPLSGGKRRVVTSHRDTWVQGAEGWRLLESIEVSYHWILPPTSAADARPVVADLKKAAMPLDEATDLAPFGAAVGDARIVALGESARGTREFNDWKRRLTEYLVTRKGFTVVIGAGDAEARALSGRPNVTVAAIEGDNLQSHADSIVRLATTTYPQAKIVLWTDNTHARLPLLRSTFGRKLYSVGFAFHHGEVQAVGVEHGESRGLGVYSAPASPEGSGDAVLSAAGIPQFFLHFVKAPFDGPLDRWLGETHLFHDLGAYWVLDDPDASLQPEELSKNYDALVYVEEVHAGS